MTSPVNSSTDPTASVNTTTSTTPVAAPVSIGGGGGESTAQILQEEELLAEIDWENTQDDERKYEINQAQIKANLSPLNGGAGTPIDPTAINRLKKLSNDKI